VSPAVWSWIEWNTGASGSGDGLTWTMPSSPERFLQGGLN